MKVIEGDVKAVLLHQLRNFWTDIEEESFSKAVPYALGEIERNFVGMPNEKFWDGKEVVFSPYVSVQWMNFLYRLSRVLFLDGKQKSADQVYYLNKILHSNDWLYSVELPIHFHCEHPLGSILGKARYGDYLFVYQGTTVGGNRTRGVLDYPVIGDNVILYANSTVLGKCNIGKNVVVAADTYLINEVIPDNCIVFGRSPNVVIKQKSECEIKEYTKHIWGWV